MSERTKMTERTKIEKRLQKQEELIHLIKQYCELNSKYQNINFILDLIEYSENNINDSFTVFTHPTEEEADAIKKRDKDYLDEFMKEEPVMSPEDFKEFIENLHTNQEKIKDDPATIDFYNKLQNMYEEEVKKTPLKENGEIDYENFSTNLQQVLYVISQRLFKEEEVKLMFKKHLDKIPLTEDGEYDFSEIPSETLYKITSLFLPTIRQKMKLDLPKVILKPDGYIKKNEE